MSRAEFDQMMKNVAKDQADRIFDSCDTVGDNQISMEEFRQMVSKKDNAQQKWVIEIFIKGQTFPRKPPYGPHWTLKQVHYISAGKVELTWSPFSKVGF